MKKLNLLLAICCVLIVAVMQAQANRSPDVPEIQGIVTKSGSGEKLAGVEITFEGTRRGRAVRISSTTSRDDGTFYLRDRAFLGLGEQSITVTATLNGYATWSKVVTLDSSPLVINIELTPAT